ncbi:MAG: 2-oxo acid dehydrogenase subunit E2 [Wenzhouxiangellaceae bacterium]|nr:2-oxo acid dehydrogenase subunit E2 [Wenzhouxiangellaceae bacterium]MBS3746867.1 2-oxo acid dehydrogenase subunit E2 [Wenzhouxiangellaceae bacterium]MBS3824375.1 2-oxo acid dehydrogenase subunit E2 [Wenzhouxiangellaceae bacterium]
MKTFNLPDLGEGLPDAEIVEWLVAEGDEVKVDDPIVSMETAKAVVEVPSPYAGKVAKFHGQAGDVIKTGAPLIDFDTGEGVETAAEGEAGEDQSAEPKLEPQAAEPAPDDDVGQAGEERADTGTVVGNVTTSDEVVQQTHSSVGGVKVTPAVRALARKLKIDLSTVEATGPEGVVTSSDVRRAAEEGPTRKPAAAPAREDKPAAPPEPLSETEREPQAEARPSGPSRSEGAQSEASGEWTPIRGTRRTMARAMSDSHARVVATTIMDDADIHAWQPGEDITVRLLRALWAGAQEEPGLNAWYDDEQNVRMVHKGMHVGMAVDTPDGLFVARLKDVHSSDRQQMRGEIDRLRDNVKHRSIPPEDLKGYTIMLSNFGVFAGRYATPIINPPCVAIVAAGVLRHEVVPVLGGIEVHRQLPLSLTFDHRICTGGEAARFLKAMIEDLRKSQ